MPGTIRKRAGISLALTGYQQMRDDYTVDKTLTIVKRFLCTQEYAGRIGIMLEDAKLPWASKRLQTMVSLLYDGKRFCRFGLVGNGSTGDCLPETFSKLR